MGEYRVANSRGGRAQAGGRVRGCPNGGVHERAAWGESVTAGRTLTGNVHRPGADLQMRPVPGGFACVERWSESGTRLALALSPHCAGR